MTVFGASVTDTADPKVELKSLPAITVPVAPGPTFTPPWGRLTSERSTRTPSLAPVMLTAGRRMSPFGCWIQLPESSTRLTASSSKWVRLKPENTMSCRPDIFTGCFCALLMTGKDFRSRRLPPPRKVIGLPGSPERLMTRSSA